ncbi:hypothetical protein T492DRAFT_835202 [Pavlovales sp. CCMP2436]|nr:hypothetical protein T492DRAFT_835202 [Pavlovales sp. CCMP2436]
MAFTIEQVLVELGSAAPGGPAALGVVHARAAGGAPGGRKGGSGNARGVARRLLASVLAAAAAVEAEETEVRRGGVTVAGFRRLNELSLILNQGDGARALGGLQNFEQAACRLEQAKEQGVFDDCSPDRMMRKSPDRIDTSKGYEPGNVPRALQYDLEP